MKYMIPMLLLLAGCKSLTLDPSPAALASGDYTLVSSACQNVPGQGADICRVVDGTPIDSVWKLVVPYNDNVVSAELKVRYKDIVNSYPVKSKVVEIPWKDITGHDVWATSDDGLAQVTGTFRYKTGTNNAEFVDVLGIAMLVVLAKDYSPMPIDSGSQFFSANCKVQYSSAGRSALQCK